MEPQVDNRSIHGLRKIQVRPEEANTWRLRTDYVRG